jgi:hypothetical protein
LQQAVVARHTRFEQQRRVSERHRTFGRAKRRSGVRVCESLGGEHADRMTDRDDFLAWVRTALYEAELALHNGDAAPRRALWSATSP